MVSAKQIQNQIKKNNNSLYNSFFKTYNYDFDLKKIKKFKKFKTIIVIGMGGSILGAKAIYSFLKHKIKKKFIFIDNLDQAQLYKLKRNYSLSSALFLIISKSGNTNETIINSSYFKGYYKKSNVIVISESKKNILSNFARKKNLNFFKHDPSIGGRYSIFSEAGMLPAYLMGLNPKNFKKNSDKFFNDKKMLSNSLTRLKKINFKKYKILIFFNYVPELNDFLYWGQQLLAESLGKKKKGFMPVVSSAPKDHHSLLQLYLDGPKDKIFYVFNSTENTKLKLNCNPFGKAMNYVNNKSYHKVKKSQSNAFIEILKKNKTPFREFNIKKFDEQTLGKLFLSFIFETISLGKIMKINPFDQPAVEKVKILTKKFLVSKKISKKNF